MTLKIKTVLFWLIIISFGCDNNIVEDIKVIKLNPNEAKDEINLSEIADSVLYIKLQTNAESVMGRLFSLTIKDKYIYVVDKSQQILFVFDRTGKYISKLDKRGKAPDEYMHMGGVFIDDNEEYIELLDNSRNSAILKYSNIEFKLLNKSPLPNLSYNSFRRVNSTLYFACQQNENLINGEITNAGIIVVNNGKIKGTLFNKFVETKNTGYSPNSESLTVNDKGKLFASIVFDNTFYQIEKMNANPVLKIDFGKHGIDNSIGLKSIPDQLKYIENINGLASFPVLNINNTGIMSFSYYFKQNSKNRMFSPSDYRYYIELKNSNKIYHTKRIKNDITSFPDEIYLSSYFRRVAHEAWYKNYLVDVVIPSYYFKNGETQVSVENLGEIKITDNPIVVLVKLKNEIR